MKRAAIVAAVVLSLVFAVSAFAIEGSEPAPNFEQIKADHLKKLDDKITSLQQVRGCIQAAENRDDLTTCIAARGKRGGHGGPGGPIPPQDK